jgi:hypothetical protein
VHLQVLCVTLTSTGPMPACADPLAEVLEMTVQQLVWKVLPAAIPALMAVQVPPLTASCDMCIVYINMHQRSRDPINWRYNPHPNRPCRTVIHSRHWHSGLTLPLQTSSLPSAIMLSPSICLKVPCTVKGASCYARWFAGHQGCCNVVHDI